MKAAIKSELRKMLVQVLILFARMLSEDRKDIFNIAFELAYNRATYDYDRYLNQMIDQWLYCSKPYNNQFVRLP